MQASWASVLHLVSFAALTDFFLVAASAETPIEMARMTVKIAVMNMRIVSPRFLDRVECDWQRSIRKYPIFGLFGSALGEFCPGPATGVEALRRRRRRITRIRVLFRH